MVRIWLISLKRDEHREEWVTGVGLRGGSQYCLSSFVRLVVFVFSLLKQPLSGLGKSGLRGEAVSIRGVFKSGDDFDRSFSLAFS